MAIIKNRASWISKSFASKKTTDGREQFVISDVLLNTIIATVPPPLYIYDAATIRQQYDRLFTALHVYGIDIYYSVKANTALAILQLLSEMGAGFEIASLGELL